MQTSEEEIKKFVYGEDLGCVYLDAQGEVVKSPSGECGVAAGSTRSFGRYEGPPTRMCASA